MPQTNFSLEPIRLSNWSATHDFDAKENLADQYLTNSQLESELTALAAKYPLIVSVGELGKNSRTMRAAFPSTSAASSSVFYALVSDSNVARDKINIAIVASLSGNTAVGSEMAIRFLRHLARGLYCIYRNMLIYCTCTPSVLCCNCCDCVRCVYMVRPRSR